MKVVITDALTLGNDIDLNRFKDFGELYIYPTSTPEEAAERLSDADIAIVNKVPINIQTIGDSASLKIVALTATGYNNVDLDYTKSRNITVTNVAGYSTESVVQHTFALLFYVLEKLNYYDNYVKSGEYTKSPVFCNFDRKFMELHGKTWGIIGLGKIGNRVASIASAFGCKIIYYSTSGLNRDSIYEQVTFDELLATSDIVSIHAPLNSVTENLMDYEAFCKMKPNSILLNLARGPIVNEADLIRALNEKLIDGAGLDVISKEPVDADNPLLSFTDSSRLIVTPHIAWATFEARSRLVDEVYKNLESFLRGESRNVVEPVIQF